METTRILVTGAGGPAAIGFMRAVEHLPIELFAVDMDAHAAGLYLVPAAHRALVPAGSHNTFVQRLHRLCRKWRIDVLVPTVDCELLPLATARCRFKNDGIKIMLSHASALSQCLDKWLLHERCQGVVPLPETTLLNKRAQPFLPAIAKPRVGSGSRGVQEIRHSSALLRAPSDGSFLLQELLPGEEYSVDVLADRHGHVCCAVPRARLKVDSGVAVTSRTVNDEELVTLASRVVEHLRLQFVSNVQFKRRADGSPVLLEINPRFPGTMALTVASGVNMPELALRSLLGEEIRDLVLPFCETTIVRYLEHRVVPNDELESLAPSRMNVSTDVAMA